MLKHAIMKHLANKEIIPSKPDKVRMNEYVYIFEKNSRKLLKSNFIYERQKRNTIFVLYTTKLKQERISKSKNKNQAFTLIYKSLKLKKYIYTSMFTSFGSSNLGKEKRNK